MMRKLLARYVLFPFVGRKNMPDADVRTQNAQYLGVADDQSPARDLQRVLSLSSPSFYRCALRLLGNRYDAELHRTVSCERRERRAGRRSCCSHDFFSWIDSLGISINS